MYLDLKLIKKIIKYYQYENESELYKFFYFLNRFRHKLSFFLFNYFKFMDTNYRKNNYNINWKNSKKNYVKWFNRTIKDDLHFDYLKNNYFFSSTGILNRIWLSCIYKFLQKKKINKVLEIGSGIGTNIFFLASFFPKKKFYGLELTTIGTNIAKNILKKKIKDEIYFGFPIKPSRKILNNCNFQSGNAKKIKYKDNSFELVFSLTALENMDHIKNEVINEMIRVSSKYKIFIEPFTDCNTNILKKLHHRGSQYFNLSINELRKFPLKIISIEKEVVQKISLSHLIVICEKI